MKFLPLYFLLFLTLAGCGSARPKITSQGEIEIINLGERFKVFWEKAKDKSFIERVELWDEYVEGLYVSLYQNLVWRSSSDPHWKKRKELRLVLAFRMYELFGDRILQTYKTFEDDLREVVTEFKKKFPDAKLNSSIYLLPFGLDMNIAYTSIGKGGTDPNYRPIMVIGSDMLGFFHEDRKRILAHEIFHVYHFEKLGPQKAIEFLSSQEYLTTTLIAEGLAEWAANGIYENNQSKGYVYQILNKNFDAKDRLDALSKFNQSIVKMFDTPSVCQRALSDLPSEGHFTCEEAYSYGETLISNLIKKHGITSVLNMSFPQMKEEFKIYLRGQKDVKALILLKVIEK